MLINLRRECKECKKEWKIKIRPEDWAIWRAGEDIEYALPYVDENGRLLLSKDLCIRCSKESEIRTN